MTRNNIKNFEHKKLSDMTSPFCNIICVIEFLNVLGKKMDGTPPFPPDHHQPTVYDAVLKNAVLGVGRGGGTFLTYF